MLKISKKLEYSLIVLKHFLEAPQGEKVTARSICDLYKTPFDTTAKVMQIMNAQGILESNQGVKGGYKVVLDLQKINFLDLLNIIEGKEFHKSCNEQKCTLIESCNISGPVNKLNQYLFLFFQNLSVKELLAENEQKLISFPSLKVHL